MNTRQDNPFAPPSMAEETSEDLNRQELLQTIEAFTSGEINVGEFETRVFKFLRSEDPIVESVASKLIWISDDDPEVFVFDRELWNYFQRILLVLHSNCRVETHRKNVWSFRQIIAISALLAFAFFGVQLGWGPQLLFLTVPLGFVSIALSRWELPSSEFDRPYAMQVAPFASFSDLANCYRNSGFRKVSYPAHLANERQVSWLEQPSAEFCMYATWLLFAPITLLAQSCPAQFCENRYHAA